MKKKNSRSIPDFSSKRKEPVAPGNPGPKLNVPAHGRPQPTKPQATSSKSGRRGQ